MLHCITSKNMKSDTHCLFVVFNFLQNRKTIKTCQNSVHLQASNGSLPHVESCY